MNNKFTILFLAFTTQQQHLVRAGWFGCPRGRAKPLVTDGFTNAKEDVFDYRELDKGQWYEVARDNPDSRF